jgi:pyruvate dehydrogenase complex dehydrogenase (E1) component
MIKLGLNYNYSYLGGVFYASSSLGTKPVSFFKEKTIKNLKLVLKKTKSFTKYLRKFKYSKIFIEEIDGRPIASEKLRKVKPNGFTALWLEKFGESDSHVA